MRLINATFKPHWNQPRNMPAQSIPKWEPIVRLVRRLASLLPSLCSHRTAVSELADGYDRIAQRQSDPQLASLYRDAARQIRCS